MIFLLLALFCFLSAFKRIAIAAILAAVALGWLMRILSRRGNVKTARRLMQIILLFSCAALVLYIAFDILFSDMFNRY